MQKKLTHFIILYLFTFGPIHSWANDSDASNPLKKSAVSRHKRRHGAKVSKNPWSVQFKAFQSETLSSKKSQQSSSSILHLTLSKRQSKKISWASQMGLISKETLRYKRETLLTNAWLSGEYSSRQRGAHRLDFMGQIIAPTNRVAYDYDSYRGSISPQMNYSYIWSKYLSLLINESIYLNFHKYETSAGDSNNSQVSNSLYIGVKGNWLKNLSSQLGFEIEESWSYFGTRQDSIAGLSIGTQLNMENYVLGVNFSKSNRINNVAGEITGEDLLFELDNYRVGVFLGIKI